MGFEGYLLTGSIVSFSALSLDAVLSPSDRRSMSRPPGQVECCKIQVLQFRSSPDFQAGIPDQHSFQSFEFRIYHADSGMVRTPNPGPQSLKLLAVRRLPKCLARNAARGQASDLNPRTGAAKPRERWGS